MRATADLTCISWLDSFLPLASSSIGTTLPPLAEWQPQGVFVRVFTVGGTKERNTPLRRSRIQLDVYSADPGSKHPDWGRAAQLCEDIIARVDVQFAAGEPHEGVAIRGEQHDLAILHDVEVLTDPVRQEPDETSYARMQFDVQITWVSA